MRRYLNEWPDDKVKTGMIKNGKSTKMQKTGHDSVNQPTILKFYFWKKYIFLVKCVCGS